MALITTSEQIKAYTGISKSASEKAYVYQKVAEKAMKLQIGQAKYSEFENAMPDDADAGLATQAEAFLALHYSLTPMALRVADNGGLLRLVGHGDYQEELMSANMVAVAKKQLYAMAIELIQDFIPDLEDEEEPGKQYKGTGFGLTMV